MEIYQEFGNDLVVNENGDLQSVDGLELSNQRIIRRLMNMPISLSNPPDYLEDPTYGAGLPKFIGDPNTNKIYNQIKASITAQIYLEDTVAQNPAPVIDLTGLPDRLEGSITYTYIATNQQAVVSFKYPLNSSSQ
jgi:hypothetical protein